jgi:glutathione S-transferase
LKWRIKPAVPSGNRQNVAALAGTSRAHLTLVMRNRVGKPVRQYMTRKGRLSKAADAAKVLAKRATRRLEQPVGAARTVAGEALGAAATAATGVVAKRVADAISEGGEKVRESTPHLQQIAAKTVSQPLLKRRKRAAARQSRTSKKKAGSARVSKKRARA